MPFVSSLKRCWSVRVSSQGKSLLHGTRGSFKTILHKELLSLPPLFPIRIRTLIPLKHELTDISHSLPDFKAFPASFRIFFPCQLNTILPCQKQFVRFPLHKSCRSDRSCHLVLIDEKKIGRIGREKKIIKGRPMLFKRLTWFSFQNKNRGGKLKIL